MLRRLAIKCWNFLLSFPRIKVNPIFLDFFNKRINHIRGWISLEESFVLYSAGKAIMPDESIVEIGSYEGRSTIALGKALQEGKRASTQMVYSIDPHTGDITEVQKGLEINTWNKFISNITDCNLRDVINPIRLTSNSAVSHVSGVKVGLLFVDGWHSYEAVKSDIWNFLPLTSKQSIIIFDDWRQPDILRAILEAIQDLPDFLGFIGKDLVFSNSEVFNKSSLGKTLKIRLQIATLLNSIYQDDELSEVLKARNLRL
jgi:hypothetical protein